MYSSAVASCIYCSLKKCEDKLELFQSFYEFDRLIANQRELRWSCLKFIKRIEITFFIFWSISIAASATFVINDVLVDFQLFAYAIKIVVMNHIIHIEMFQIFTFVKGIQHRLKIISKEFMRLDKSVRRQTESLIELQNIFLKLFTTNQQLNSCFELPLIVNMMGLHSSILLNVYLMGKAYFEYPFAFVSGETFC